MTIKGIDNVAAEHLSRLIIEFSRNPFLISDFFSDEHLLSLSISPWYADNINYLVIGQIPSYWTKPDHSKFKTTIKYYAWDDPYLFEYS